MNFIIDNCEFKFRYKCPLYWSKLKKTDDSNIKYCSGCSKLVYKCSNETEINRHINANHCVAIENMPLMGYIKKPDDD